MLHKLLCLAAILIAAQPVQAGHCNRVAVRHHANFAAQFVAVPYAVPVAVPVAPINYVNYGAAFGGVGYNYQSFAGFNNANALRAPAPCPPCPTPAPAAANLSASAQATVQTAQSSAAPAAPQTTAHGAASGLLQATCLKCHSGEEAKGGFRVDLPLTCEQKLAGIRALLSDDPEHRMPRDTVISDQDRGLLIQELSK